MSLHRTNNSSLIRWIICVILFKFSSLTLFIITSHNKKAAVLKNHTKIQTNVKDFSNTAFLPICFYFKWVTLILKHQSDYCMLSVGNCDKTLPSGRCTTNSCPLACPSGNSYLRSYPAQLSCDSSGVYNTREPLVPFRLPSCGRKYTFMIM